MGTCCFVEYLFMMCGASVIWVIYRQCLSHMYAVCLFFWRGVCCFYRQQQSNQTFHHVINSHYWKCAFPVSYLYSFRIEITAQNDLHISLWVETRIITGSLLAKVFHLPQSKSVSYWLLFMLTKLERCFQSARPRPLLLFFHGLISIP